MACVEFYLEQVYTVEGLFFDYGQPAVKAESVAANKIATHYGIQLRTIQIPKLCSNSLGEIYGRNAIFAMCALGVNGYGTYKIAIGIHAGTSYSDCSVSFVDQMNRLYDLYANGTIILEG